MKIQYLNHFVYKIIQIYQIANIIKKQYNKQYMQVNKIKIIILIQKQNKSHILEYNFYKKLFY